MDDPYNGVMAEVPKAVETGEFDEDTEARIEKTEPPAVRTSKQEH